MTEMLFNNSITSSPHAQLFRDIAVKAAAQLANSAQNISFRTRLYHATLSGPMPDRLLAHPTELRQSSAGRANELLEGRYSFPGGVVQANSRVVPWLLVAPSKTWAENLHGFSWLRDFKGPRDARVKQHIHWLVSTWINECGIWHDIAWRPHVVGRRLISWFSHSELLFNDSDLIWRSVLLRSIAHQSRHLRRTAKWAEEGEPKLTAAIGLSLSGLCLPDGVRRLERGLQLLERELKRQVLPDGGHINRKPSTQFQMLADLLALKDTFAQRKRLAPEFIQKFINRIAPMLRFFKHGDGRLALFNGATEEDTGAIEAILSRDDAKGQPVNAATHMGYQRMKSGRLLILVDTGPSPKKTFSGDAHAGCLSFEMSAGRHRVVVNCGSTIMRGPDWHKACRATAAHSTLTLADKSSARIVQRPLITKLLGPRIAEGPAKVYSRRDEYEGETWLQCSHDGYVGRFGLIHDRHLYLSHDGYDLRGEDKLVPPLKTTSRQKWFRFSEMHKNSAVPFALRFHLHPDVRATTTHQGGKILLMFPDGDGCQFLTNLPNLTLEESIYMGAGEVIRRSKQIVVSGIASRGETTSVKWAFSQLKHHHPPANSTSRCNI